MRSVTILLLCLGCFACAHPNPKRDGDKVPDPAVGRTQGTGGAMEADTNDREFSQPVRNFQSRPDSVQNGDR